MKSLRFPYDDAFTAELSVFLRNKRVQAGLSQKVVSKRLGYKSAQFVSNWERGKTVLPLSILNKLIQMYRIDSQEVLRVLINHIVRIIRDEILNSNLDVDPAK